ncbi:hypothetical protein IGS67_12935 [Flavimobilis sp. GY10621]|uniref:Tfp pilus assembly protein PilN n=1 Tax=Flavimobilis rhizosphaerae TaxID=2775421 RepID=A0ABR9DTP9_9MICO|nr:hypothetical protein [Flavimobilis rhizosphaerae]MBD9700378.1 hypothetical protein [Flavimobilis rhizosphaerae]
MSLQLKMPRRTRAAASLADVGAPPLAQVNLLPSGVRNLSRERLVRNVMILVVLVAVVLAGLLWLMGTLTVSSAQDQLDVAETRTRTLTAEKLSLAPVRAVEDQRVTAELAQQVGMSTEIAWTPLVAAMAAQLPENSVINEIVMVQETPLAVLEAPTDSLVPGRVATFTVVTRSPEELETSEWISNLDAIPGFAHARILKVVRGGDESDVWFDTTTAVTVEESAFSMRFAVDAEGGK